MIMSLKNLAWYDGATAWWQALKWLPVMVWHALHNSTSESFWRGVHTSHGLFVESSYWRQKKKIEKLPDNQAILEWKQGREKRGERQWLLTLLWLNTSVLMVLLNTGAQRVPGGGRCPNPVLSQVCHLTVWRWLSLGESCLSGSLNNVDCCACACVWLCVCCAFRWMNP